MQVLRRRAHRHRGGVDEALGDEAWVEVDLVAHRMVAHVLDAPRDDDVGCAERDLTGPVVIAESAPAHMRSIAKPGTLEGSPASSHVTPEREALIANLGRRRDDHVADPLGRDARRCAAAAPHELAHHVVGARAPEDAVLARPPERGSDAVDEHDLAESARHGARIASTGLAAPARPPGP